MKAQLITTLWLGIITAGIILLSSFDTASVRKTQDHALPLFANTLQREALEILQTKCNICHRKQNPLMVFKEKNMSKRAKKIYKQVFIEKRMPKGDEIRLSNEEYIALEKWLFTQEIF